MPNKYLQHLLYDVGFKIPPSFLIFFSFHPLFVPLHGSKLIIYLLYLALLSNVLNSDLVFSSFKLYTHQLGGPYLSFIRFPTTAGLLYPAFPVLDVSI